MKFYLGTHRPGWLDKVDVSLFVSRTRLHDRKSMPRARTSWALDSGGFTQLSIHGRWTFDAATYVADVRRFDAEIGSLDWAAPMDWMCEPHVLTKTGLTVAEHQRRTVDSVIDLRSRAPEQRWIPVLQGFTRDDYLRCADLYADRGIDLAAEPTVGLGSVCRRQSTTMVEGLVQRLAGDGIKLHGFGVKSGGLRRMGELLASADSMAWSFVARRRPVRLDGCTHANCANCQRWALQWRRELLDGVALT